MRPPGLSIAGPGRFGAPGVYSLSKLPGGSRRPLRNVRVASLGYGSVDFDRPFKVGTIFDHDLRCGQIPDDRTALPDLDASLRSHVPFDIAVHLHIAGIDVSRKPCRRSDRELSLFKLD